jgi:hypothetical protein
MAAPFFDAEGDCRGSVVFTRPAMRHTDDLPVVGDAVVKAAGELSQRLGWSPAGGGGGTGAPGVTWAAASIRPLVIYQFGMPPAQVALRCCGWPPTGRRWGCPFTRRAE